MPTTPLRISFETKGATQLVDGMAAASKAQLAYGRSLPTKAMNTYRREMRSTISDLSKVSSAQERFSNILIRTELQTKNARLGFTQFKKELRPNEIRKFATEIGRLDHILGSANRTFRVSNQQLADRGFNQKTLGRVQSNVKRYIRDLSRVRKSLDGVFESGNANAFVRSLDRVEKNLLSIESISRKLQRFEIPFAGGKNINIPKLSRDFRFPTQLQNPSRTERVRDRLGRGARALNRVLTPTPSDRQGRLAANARQLRDIDRLISPLASASERARVNLDTIKRGTEASLNVLEEQIQLHRQLSLLGNKGSERRLQELVRQRDFILENIRARERESLIANQNLSLARTKTAIDRASLEDERKKLQQFGIQRSVLSDIFNLGVQINKVLAETGGVLPQTLGGGFRALAGLGEGRSDDVLRTSNEESLARFEASVSRMAAILSEEAAKFRTAIRGRVESGIKRFNSFFERLNNRGGALARGGRELGTQFRDRLRDRRQAFATEVRGRARSFREAARRSQRNVRNEVQNATTRVVDAVVNSVARAAGVGLRGQEILGATRARLARAIDDPRGAVTSGVARAREAATQATARINDRVLLQFIKLNNGLENLGKFFSDLRRGRVNLTGGRTFGLRDRTLGFRRAGRFISDNEVGAATRRLLRGVAVAINAIDPRNILRGERGNLSRQRLRQSVRTFGFREFRIPGDQLGERIRESIGNIPANIFDPIRKSLVSIIDISNNLGNSLTASFRNLPKQISSLVKNAQNLTKQFAETHKISERFRKGITLASLGVRRMSDGFILLRQRGREFLNIARNTRSAVAGIAERIVRADYSRVIEFGSEFRNAIAEVRRTGGFADIFRSADVQLERIEGKLRELGRDLIAPTERIRAAQAEFDVIEAETQLSLATLNRNIDKLRSEGQELDALRKSLERVQTESKGIELDISLQQSIIEEARRPLERELEFLQGDLNEITANIFTDLGERASEESFTLEELRETIEATEEVWNRLTDPNREQLADPVELTKIRSNLIALRGALDPIEARISTLRDGLRTVRKDEQEATGELLAQQERLKRTAIQIEKSIFDAENIQVPAAAAIEKTRDILQENLDAKREELEFSKLEFNQTKARINQEQTLLNIRKDRLNARKETGGGADTVIGAAADLGRGIGERVRRRSLIGDLEGERELGEETSLATQQFADLTNQLIDAQSAVDGFGGASLDTSEGLSQLNNAFGIGQAEVDEYGQTLNRAGAIIVEIDEQQQGIINSIKQRVSNFVSSPVETSLNVIRNLSFTATGLLQNVASRVTSTAQAVASSIVRLFINVTDGIAQIPIRVLGIIPVVGDGLSRLAELVYGIAKDVTETAANVAIIVGKGVVSTIQGIFSSIYNSVQTVINGIASVVEFALRGVFSRLEGLAKAALQSITNVLSGLRDLYINALRGIVDVVRDSFTRVTGAIRTNISSILGRVRGLITDIGSHISVVLLAPWKLIGDLITSPFETLRNIITSIGGLIEKVIIAPLRPVVAILTAPLRALGVVFNAFNYNHAPRTRQNLRAIREEGGEAVQSMERVAGHFRRQTDQRKQRNREYITNVHTVRRQTDATADSLVRNLRGIDDVFRILSQGADNLTTSVSTLHTSFSNLALGATAFLAIFGGVLAAGKRADAYKGIILAFEQTGISLERLSEAAGRTIRDIGIMQAANVALSNTPELVRKAFAEQASGINESSHEALQAYKAVIGDAGGKSGIVGLMEIARAQAIRTGESTSFLFQSLTSGVKRSSPKLIDNTGIVIKIGQANEKFAEALGKTVGELTATEKQLALLAETVRAGSKSLGLITKDTEGARQKFERFKATAGDIADRITFGLQPALEGTLDFFNALGERVKEASVVIATGLYAGTTVFIEGTEALFSAGYDTVSALGNTIRQIISNLLSSVGVDISTIAFSAADVLTSIVTGAANTFGTAAGVIAGVFHTIVDTVRKALQDIANMLLGDSPPPEGPLKDIDKGARNTFLAWQEGFESQGVGGIQNYAKNLAESFSFILDQELLTTSGDIVAETFAKAEAAFGHLSTRELQKRLEGLEATFKPFEERLAAVRKHFEAIRESAQFARDAISKRIDSLLQDVIDGSEMAAEQVRQLGELHGTILAGNRLEEQRLENAAIGVELAKARTAEERALIELLLSQREVEEAGRSSSSGGGDSDRAGRKRTSRDPREKIPKGSEGAEEEVEEVLRSQLPLGNTFAGFLLPEYEEIIRKGGVAFENAFNTASEFITGGPDLTVSDDPFAEQIVSTADRPSGNVFERFFDSLGETIRGGPDAIKQALEDAFNDIKEKIGELSPELAAGVQVVWDFAFGDVPLLITSFVDAIANPLGINDWIKQNSAELGAIGAIDFDQTGTITLGNIVASIPNIAFTLVSDVANAWTNYVKKIQDELKIEQSDGTIADLNALERVIGLAFEDDFTLNIQAPFEFLLSYVSGTGDAAQGQSLGKDLEAWWNDGAGLVEVVESIITAAGNAVSFVVSNTVKIIASLTDVVLSVFIDPETLQPTNVANLIAFAARTALGVVAFPLFIARYLFETPVGEISLAGAVAKIVGIDELELANLPAEVNTFLTTTLPTELDKAFGENNIATALVDIANTIRSRIHEVLFGEGLLSDESVPEVNESEVLPDADAALAANKARLDAAVAKGRQFALDAIARGGVVNAAELQARYQLLYLNIEKELIAAENAAIANVAKERSRLLELNQNYADFEDDNRTGFVGAIIERLEAIPDQVSEFLGTEEGKNIFNLHSILVAAGIIEEEETLQDLWEDTVDEFTKFFDDPAGYLTQKLDEGFAGFKDGVLSWTNDPENPVTIGINAIGTFLTGDENFNIGDIAQGFFDGIDALARDLRISFGVASVEDFIAAGFDVSPATELARNQRSKSILEVVLNGVRSLRDSVVKDITDNPQNYSFIDDILGALFNTSLQEVVTPKEGEAEKRNVQEEQFIDTVSQSVFGKPLAEVPGFLAGMPERFLTAIRGELPEGTSRLDHVVAAVFDHEGLTAADLIPNLITAIRTIPQAIIEALTLTDDFGIDVPIVESGTISQGLSDGLGKTVTGFERQFSIAPFLKRITKSLVDSAVRFFDETPLGESILSVFRWFSGDDDFTAASFAEGVYDFITGDEQSRNDQILSYLQAHPNLFGLDTLVQFFTGDESWTLAGAFESAIGQQGGAGGLLGGLGGSIQRTVQGIIDGITGDVRAGSEFQSHGISPDTIIGNRGNIFQRVADAIKEAAGIAFTSVQTFFQQQADAGVNFLGLDNFVAALTGNPKENVASFLAKFTDSDTTSGFESFPQLVQGIFTAISNLFSTNQSIAEGTVESPFAALWDPEHEGGLAWSLTPGNGGIRDGFDNLITALGEIPKIIEGISKLVTSIRRTIVRLGGGSNEEVLEFGTQDLLAAGDFGALLDLTGFSINNPIVREQIKNAGLKVKDVANAIFEARSSAFLNAIENRPESFANIGHDAVDIVAELGNILEISDSDNKDLLLALSNAYETLGIDAVDVIEEAFARGSKLDRTEEEFFDESGFIPDTREAVTSLINILIPAELSGLEEQAKARASDVGGTIVNAFNTGIQPFEVGGTQGIFYQVGEKTGEEGPTSFIDGVRAGVESVGEAVSNTGRAIYNIVKGWLSGDGDTLVESFDSPEFQGFYQLGVDAGSDVGSQYLLGINVGTGAFVGDISDNTYGDIESIKEEAIAQGEKVVTTAQTSLRERIASLSSQGSGYEPIPQVAILEGNPVQDVLEDAGFSTENAVTWGEEVGKAGREALVSFVEGKLETDEGSINFFAKGVNIAELSEADLLKLQAYGEAYSTPIQEGVDKIRLDPSEIRIVEPHLGEGVGGDGDYQWAERIGEFYKEQIEGGLDSPITRDGIPSLIDSLEASSPPDTGPLSSIDTWGTAVGEAYRDSLIGAINTALTDDEILNLLATLRPDEDGELADGPLSGAEEWGNLIGTAWVSGFQAPFTNFFGAGGGEGEEGGDTPSISDVDTTGGEDSGEGQTVGSWGAILDTVYLISVEFAKRIPTAFAPIPGQLWDVFVEPTIKLFNDLLSSFNAFLHAFSLAQNTAASLGLLVPTVDISGLVVDNIPTPPRPTAVSLEGAATGGTFGPGGLIVGEQGPELIVPSQRITVFPNQVTQGLAELNNVLHGGYQRPIYSTTNYNYNYDNSVNDRSTNIHVDARGQRTGREIAMQIHSSRMRGF